MMDESKERAILVGVGRPSQSRWQLNDHLDELELLARTAGAEILERVVQDRDRLDSAYLIGRGKVEQIAEKVQSLELDLIIFDDDLSPAQTKNLQELCDVKIIDRSGLILDIFVRHARTREARTQVELAQLKYLLPRLTRQWKHLSRQVGGIGVRGPGETQLEIDRRLVRKRIAVLERELVRIAHQRTTQRKHRQNTFRAALVGYTNAGKSTLLNGLTGSTVKVQDQLFATLDATVRALDNSDKRSVLLIDTVGFIRKLPHHLVASFRSTLEETLEADWLLHVIDITHPGFEDQIATVNSVLKELKVGDKPLLYVFNKIDALKNIALIERMREKYQPSIFISAQRGIFLQQLRQQLLEYAEQSDEEFAVIIPVEHSQLIAKLYDWAQVLEIEYTDGQARAKIRTTPQNAQKISRRVRYYLESKQTNGS
ncbi:GTPase HflX [candidate division KSB1 bacterium]|nr:GTPase HflX [candidate division KSB1 bacterium]